VSQTFPVKGERGTVARFTCHGMTLEVKQGAPGVTFPLGQLVEGLWWVRTSDRWRQPRLRLILSQHERRLEIPRGVRPMPGLNGLQGVAVAHQCYLTDGYSLLQLQPEQGQGFAQLAPNFFARPSRLQRAFWTYGLLKLLRPLGAYWLHAAGVVNHEGMGVLIIGPSGSGKSTLTIGLIRQGWSYLSDDALLLRQQSEGVAALAWRRHASVDATTAAAYVDLPLGAETADPTGKPKRRVAIEAVYPGQHMAGCLPQVLLFPRIAPQACSVLVALDRPTALKQLLSESGPALFDHATMSQHLTILTRLLQQAPAYELRAGLDLYQNPDRLMQLLAAAKGGRPCRGY
jgi:hypothetical protein